MYVCVYVPICRPRAHHACTCMQIDTVKIVSINHVLTLNVAHQTTEAWKEGVFEAQAGLEETRKITGRGSVHKSSIFCSNKTTFMIRISYVL